MAMDDQNKATTVRRCRPANRYLDSMEADFLYHIGFNKKECKEVFQDVKFVVTGGSATRMGNFAKLIAENINYPYEDLGNQILTDGKKRTDRFCFYKIGPVLSVSHGMGVPSITILLHEILKLLYYAGAEDPIILRMGTSGGIDVNPGTIIVTNKSFNAFLKESHDVVICGKVVSRSTEMDQELAREIVSFHDSKDFVTVEGGTMCVDDFYEADRLDGVVCEITKKKKKEYMQRLKDAGVKNIEMECTALASLCKLTGVKCAIVCVALVNRMNEDQVDIPPELYTEYQLRPQKLIASFIKSRL